MIYLKSIKKFAIYKMFSYDILFYYGISMLYLTITKGVTTSQVLLMGSIFSIVSMLLQIPAAIVADKIGFKKSMTTGNILITLWGVLTIVAPNFKTLILADIFLAIGFALKGVSESPYIFEIMKKEKNEEEVSRVEGKGSALYFVFEAFACVISGFLFKTNPYIPIVFSTLCALTATYLSFSFIDLPKQNIDINNKDYFNDLKHGFKFIFNSSRLKAMFLFACIFYGVLAVGSSFSRVYLADLKLSPVYFGIVFASMNIIAAIGSRLQRRLEKRTKNKTLTYVSLIFISSFIFLGVSYILKIPRDSLIILGVIMFGLQAFIRGGYRIIIKKYLNNFTSSCIRPKIMSIYYLIEYLGSGLALFIASRTLRIAGVGLSFILFGVLFFIIMLLCIEFMKKRIGLKMEDYDEKAIKYTP